MTENERNEEESTLEKGQKIITTKRGTQEREGSKESKTKRGRAQTRNSKPTQVQRETTPILIRESKAFAKGAGCWGR